MKIIQYIFHKILGGMVITFLLLGVAVSLNYFRIETSTFQSFGPQEVSPGIRIILRVQIMLLVVAVGGYLFAMGTLFVTALHDMLQKAMNTQNYIAPIRSVWILIGIQAIIIISTFEIWSVTFRDVGYEYVAASIFYGGVILSAIFSVIAWNQYRVYLVIGQTKEVALGSSSWRFVWDNILMLCMVGILVPALLGFLVHATVIFPYILICLLVCALYFYIQEGGVNIVRIVLLIGFGIFTAGNLVMYTFGQRNFRNVSICEDFPIYQTQSRGLDIRYQYFISTPVPFVYEPSQYFSEMDALPGNNAEVDRVVECLMVE